MGSSFLLRRLLTAVLLRARLTRGCTRRRLRVGRRTGVDSHGAAAAGEAQSLAGRRPSSVLTQSTKHVQLYVP